LHDLKAPISTSIQHRILALDWARIGTDLDQQGFATTGVLLTPTECLLLSSSYDAGHTFRSRVVMARHGFGRGEYKYFQYPLPPIVDTLREQLYPPLSGVANRWNTRMKIDDCYPDDLSSMLARCHQTGQKRPTPLLLKYGVDDYNCLHQDLYGEHVFPLQATFLLSDPDTEFSGGEFVMVEQRPRMQSRPHVVPITKGEGVIFAVHHRPVQGTRGTYRVNLRHGVSRITSGERFTMGIIFHDAT
jgi:uncharacterized protein